MSKQPSIAKAKCIALYYGGEYGNVERCILGNSVDHLTEWAFMENSIKENGYGYTFHIFKLTPIDRKDFDKAVEKYNKQESMSYKKERKSQLLAELRELDES